jgi:hypothetical protein
MKLLSILLLSATVAQAQVTDLFLNAVERVESRGNTRAVGDQGRALGSLQIWASVVADVNRIAGTNYRHVDAFDRVKARRICRIYLNHYASPKRLGRTASLQDYARIWNGGPSGHKKAATLGYWAKVQKELGR